MISIDDAVERSLKSITKFTYFAVVLTARWSERNGIGKSSLTISAKPVGVGAASQPSMRAGEHCGAHFGSLSGCSNLLGLLKFITNRYIQHPAL